MYTYVSGVDDREQRKLLDAFVHAAAGKNRQHSPPTLPVAPKNNTPVTPKNNTQLSPCLVFSLFPFSLTFAS